MVFVILVRWSLNPILGEAVPYLLQFLATLWCGRYLGFGPGLVALASAVCLPVYLVFTQSRPLPPSSARYWISFTIASAVCTFLMWLLDRQGRMLAEVESTWELANRRLEELTEAVAQREREEQRSAQLGAAVDSSDDAIISKGMDGIIQSWNYGAEQIYGYRAQEAVGQPMSLVVPPDRLEEEAEIMERIRRGDRVKHFETVRQQKDGREIPVSLSISPIRNANGEVVGVSHIARDITERKQFEDQILQSQKLESLGVLAGGLAHDFNNLLTGVMGNASLAADDLAPDSPGRLCLAEILTASQRAAVLVKQMLAYSGQGRFLVRPLDLSALIAEMAPLIRSSFPPAVKLDLRLANPLPPVHADAAQMQQMIMNLAINGAEAIGEAEGVVTLGTRARETGGAFQVVIEVVDTGCGMDQATSGRVFDPFFSTKFTGRGLGLAAAQGIVRGHGGSISVKSAPGRGSTFTVVLPATSPRDANREHTAKIRGPGTGSVLVVDDEELVRGMARAALERAGYLVETADDGSQAVERFSARPGQYDAVLLDLTMPVMNGHEALQRIHAIRPDIPVILSSGFSEVEALSRCGGTGPAGFLQKPYTAAALARKMSQTLGRTPGGNG